MKVSKWVDLGAEVDVEIGVDDIRAALLEAFSQVKKDWILEDDRPTRANVLLTLNSIAQFLKALTGEQITLLNKTQQKLTADFLRAQADRFMK